MFLLRLQYCQLAFQVVYVLDEMCLFLCKVHDHVRVVLAVYFHLRSKLIQLLVQLRFLVLQLLERVVLFFHAELCATKSVVERLVFPRHSLDIGLLRLNLQRQSLVLRRVVIRLLDKLILAPNRIVALHLRVDEFRYL